MSIRTNPMKAIPLLLKRLRTTRSNIAADKACDEKLETLMSDLNRIRDVFSTLKRNEQELLDTLTLMDGHLRNIDKNKLKQGMESVSSLQDMENISKSIRDSTRKLLPMDTNQGETSEVDNEKMHSNLLSSSQLKKLADEKYNQILDELEYEKFEETQLEDPTKSCFFSLKLFPKDVVIKKRYTIYWWIGEGFVINKAEKTAEEVGEDVIDELLKLKFIVPYGNGKCPVVNKFKINPYIAAESVSSRLENDPDRWTVHYPMIDQNIPFNPVTMTKIRSVFQLEKDKCDKDDPFKSVEKCITIFNVGASYLNFELQRLVKMKNLAVLQLGRWQDLTSYHIEVESEEFLKELKNQNELKYLSLRGISRISNLPPSITKLESLEILDLKACHNLETLPDDISSLKNLTHLDVSQCYLLEGMPKGIEKLTQLQVLKGFLIGSSRKTPCGISDLAKLKKLKRLSIHIGSEAVISDKEFENLELLSAMKCLKISWGVSNTRYINIQFIFPPMLEKLDLEGFPGDKIPEWLKPSKLPYGLKKLYIKGGKLKKLNHGEICKEWGVKILRLKYLKHLQIDEWELHVLFPSLRYMEIISVLNHPYYEWSN